MSKVFEISNPFLEISQRLDAIEKLLIERIPENRPIPKTKTYMNAKEAAEYLRIARQTLYVMTSNKRIPFLKKGKAVLFRQADLDKWLSEN
ncbi:MAG TPA: helix-turn-helix domain-containing protein [Cyclobacteriaceae bacterium]|nr:helix-turn-helix domain-containing protein [Cyclobacteriaceae bacterium]HRJ81699.1 helix-turn-helix domain-containing protein [Cyclobacteriaceae bacterium]